MECTLCSFRNPKGTATAVIIRDNKILVLERNEEPFKGQWDLPGGYMQEGETPEETLRRELTEELGVKDMILTKIGDFPGTAPWKDKDQPILSHAYLVSFKDEIVLNDENGTFKFAELTTDIAFDSNKDILEWVKKNYTFDLARVRELISQLDASAVVDEQALYRGILAGHLETIYLHGELIGMGWIFPRQTLLRHQAVVEDMIVDEKYRGQGYGDKLLVGLLDWAKSKGVEVVELTSGYHRKAAHALYKRHDFVIHETAHMLKKI